LEEETIPALTKSRNGFFIFGHKKNTDRVTLSDIAQYRLHQQQIAESCFTTPQQVVSWMIAMQAQEFAMAKWAIGLRAVGLTDAMVEKSFNEGEILRTHLMRPTWHFVSPEDIRWLLALTAPRVHALNAFYYRRAGLDTKLFKRTGKLMVKALEGGKHLTRTALQAVFEASNIKAQGETLGCIMMHAELEGLICSGPRQGKQFTYALLEERVPAAKKLTRKEALVAFVQRYFQSRGPASLQDFSYWSGLTLKDAKEGASALPASFSHATIKGVDFIFQDKDFEKQNNLNATFLMPDYDEYGMGYKDRNALLNPKQPVTGSTAYSHWLVIDGMISGTWTRAEKNKKIIAETHPSGKISKQKQQMIVSAAKRYNAFMNNEHDKFSR